MNIAVSVKGGSFFHCEASVKSKLAAEASFPRVIELSSGEKPHTLLPIVKPPVEEAELAPRRRFSLSQVSLRYIELLT